jgi:hypothetical protein
MPQNPDDSRIPLFYLSLSKFQIRDKMGTILRQAKRVEFTRLVSAREAYSRAFNTKSGLIDAAMGNRSLDAINAVRNLIVHKAGIVDSEYKKQTTLPNIPKAEVGESTSLDGQVVVDLIKPAVQSAIALILAVHDWIKTN